MIDINISALGLSVVAPQEDGPQEVTIHTYGGTPLPIPHPADPTQPLVVPTASVGIGGITRDIGLQLADRLREVCEAMPEERHSHLVTAKSLQGVEKIANVDKELRG